MYWRYKAVNDSNDIIGGTAKGSNPYLIILKLEQSGLRVIELTKTSPNDYTVSRKLRTLRKTEALMTSMIPMAPKLKWYHQITKLICRLLRRPNHF